jgi:hypothetical protein
VIVFGQIARDLVLVVGAMPGASPSADGLAPGASRRQGRQPVAALAQLGMRPAFEVCLPAAS